MQHMRPANCPWWSSRACGKGGTIWASTSLLGEILHSEVSQYNYHPSLAYVLPSSNACLSTQGDKSRTRICFCANPTRMLFDFGQLASYSLQSLLTYTINPAPINTFPQIRPPHQASRPLLPHPQRPLLLPLAAYPVLAGYHPGLLPALAHFERPLLPLPAREHSSRGVGACIPAAQASETKTRIV